MKQAISQVIWFAVSEFRGSLDTSFLRTSNKQNTAQYLPVHIRRSRGIDFCESIQSC